MKLGRSLLPTPYAVHQRSQQLNDSAHAQGKNFRTESSSGTSYNPKFRSFRSSLQQLCSHLILERLLVDLVGSRATRRKPLLRKSKLHKLLPKLFRISQGYPGEPGRLDQRSKAKESPLFIQYFVSPLAPTREQRHCVGLGSGRSAYDLTLTIVLTVGGQTRCRDMCCREIRNNRYKQLFSLARSS